MSSVSLNATASMRLSFAMIPNVRFMKIVMIYSYVTKGVVCLVQSIITVLQSSQSVAKSERVLNAYIYKIVLMNSSAQKADVYDQAQLGRSVSGQMVSPLNVQTQCALRTKCATRLN